MKSGINFTGEHRIRGHVRRDDISSFISMMMFKDVQTKIPRRQLDSQKSDRFMLDILI